MKVEKVLVGQGGCPFGWEVNGSSDFGQILQRTRLWRIA
jgi:hypothetical protein